MLKAPRVQNSKKCGWCRGCQTVENDFFCFCRSAWLRRLKLNLSVPAAYVHCVRLQNSVKPHRRSIPRVRGRRCVQDIQEHRRLGTRLHDPQGYFAAASRSARTFHRLAHGLRGKASQTFVLVSHDGFEAGGHRTIGLTVAPLRVLSRLRRPLAQKWENDHDAVYFWGCQGKACDRSAWVHSIMVAAAKGRQQSGGLVALDLAQLYEHVGQDHLWEDGHKTSFPTATAGMLVRFIQRQAFPGNRRGRANDRTPRNTTRGSRHRERRRTSTNNTATARNRESRLSQRWNNNVSKRHNTPRKPLRELAAARQACA